MKRILVLLLLLSIGLNLGMLYKISRNNEIEPRRGMMNFDHSSRMKHMRKTLDLSPEQMYVLDRVHLDMESDFEDSRNKMQELRMELRAALQADALDMDRIRALTARMAQARGHLDSLITERLIMELPSMTLEQRQEYMKRMPGGGRGRGRLDKRH
jgi:Spy/CpxP family protein refolding chaperone